MMEMERIKAELYYKGPNGKTRKRSRLHIGEDRARAFVKEYVALLRLTSEWPEQQEREYFDARKAIIFGAVVTWGNH